MPTPKTTRFTAFEFTEIEYKSAVLLSELQKAHIQTRVCEIAESIISLDASSTKELADFEVQRAFLKGQLTMCELLLDLSKTMEVEIVEESADIEARGNYVMDAPTPNLYNRGGE